MLYAIGAYKVQLSPHHGFSFGTAVVDTTHETPVLGHQGASYTNFNIYNYFYLFSHLRYASQVVQILSGATISYLPNYEVLSRTWYCTTV